MDVEGFVEACRAEWRAFDDLSSLALAPHPSDRRLQKALADVVGMASENKLMLLNLAAAHLGPGEVYVEVGCFRGLSLVGALDGHPSVAAWACDDFSEFEGDRQALADTIRRHGLDRQVHFVERDFRGFLDAAPWRPSAVGAYFFDGSHDFRAQFDAFLHILPSLAPRALVVIDDTNEPQVRAANRLFTDSTPGFTRMLSLRTATCYDPGWWNGIEVFRYDRPDGDWRPHVPRGRRRAEEFFWDGIVEGVRRTPLRRLARAVPGVLDWYRRL